jgi:hypothetical protein
MQPQPANGTILSQYDYKKSSSPGLMLADIILKGIPITFYIITSWFISSLYIVSLAVITLVSAIDFWFTKNVLGRVMVGLRWGRIIHEDGAEEFLFECKRDESQINAADKRMFWGFLVLATGFWLAMLLWNLFTLTAWVMVLVPFSLQAVNLVCFYKCSKEQQLQVAAFVEQQRGNLTQHAVNEYIIK